MPLLEQVLEKYPKEVKLVVKNFPLRNHRYSRKAAVAALAADRQGKFWAFHDALFEDFSALSEKKIEELAQKLALDSKQFHRDVKDPKLQARIGRDIQDGRQAGVRGTPTVFINGRRLKQRTLTGFSAVIEKELARAKKQ
ncbi:MAG: thioredoxin domain-containing protein [Deltaproteobacteria bacterium]|nr:thioredoxin domain-containing protein [Deltaproteobacteria bacterium]